MVVPFRAVGVSGLKGTGGEGMVDVVGETTLLSSDWIGLDLGNF